MKILYYPDQEKVQNNKHSSHCPKTNIFTSLLGAQQRRVDHPRTPASQVKIPTSHIYDKYTIGARGPETDARKDEDV